MRYYCMNLLDRIEIKPEVMTGKPVIKGTRLTVTFILGLLSHGMTVPEILSEYSQITANDVYSCLEFARS
jgi:uncharacterized protein (DUF433 family)